MKRVATTVAMVLILGGCGTLGPPSVSLVTRDGPCYVGATSGLLIADPTSGTAIIDDSNGPMPVIWPQGWTGRRVGSEVQVFSPRGDLVYTTGQRVEFQGGLADGGWLVCNLRP